MTVLSDLASGAPCERAAQQRWQQLVGDATSVAWAEAAVAGLVAETMIDASILGPATIADTTVVTAVDFDDAVIDARLRTGLLPALDRATLRERLDGGGTAAVAPVRDAMFFGIWRRTSLTSMSRLGGYGMPVLLSPAHADMDPLALAECDWRGIGVATADGAGAFQWKLPPAPPRRNGLTNMRFEQLLDLALLSTA
jgi:hypothetical protein